MIVVEKYFQHEPHFAEIISAMLSKIMRIIRYIRPTARWTKAQQERATDHFDIHFTIVDGEHGRTFDNALKQLRPTRALLVENLQVFARRRDTICVRIRQVFAIGSTLMLANGNTYTPDQEDPLVEGVMTGGYLLKEPKPRVAHNKIDEKTLEQAAKMWHGEKFRRMTNKEIAEAVGVGVVTLHRALGPRGRKAGRPKK